MVKWFKKGLFFISLGLFVVVFLFLTRDKETPPQDEFIPLASDHENDAVNDENQDGLVLVDIKGEINEPGVYELTSDSRVKDVVDLASGFTKQADEVAINLAEKVQDEMIINVPSENGEASHDGEDTANNSDSDSEQGKIRINDATQEEIESLPGIGPSKAEAIIQYREENGLFQSVEDLLEISGIGENTLENFRDDIQIP